MENKDNIARLAKKYLDNNASPYDVACLDSWLKEDIMMQEWFSSCIEMTDPTVGTVERERLNSYLHQICGSMPAGSLDTHIGDTHPRHHNRIWKWLIGAAAAIIIVTGSLFMLMPSYNPYSQPLAVSTHAGERSHVMLPDGSTLTLNHQTKILYRYDNKLEQRILDLNGEASFDVETDPEHPFIVMCDGLRIECRGTSFNVKGYPDEDNVTVVLSDGNITAQTQNQTVSMKPGTKICYDKRSHNMQSTKVNAADYTDWDTGYDRFNEDRFDDILRTMSRRYGINFNLITPSLREIRLSGSIGHKTLDETLSILSAASGAKYTVESDSTICFYSEQ